MRDRQLHAALRAFAEEAAWTFASETAEGAELPFDIVEERAGRGRPALYCYRPDTAGFIADRARDLIRLENWGAAVQALAATSGVDAYLRSRGHTHVPAAARERAEVALRAFLEHLFEDLAEFTLSDERFVRAYGELEDRVGAGGNDVEVIVPLLGIELESEQLALSAGLSLVRPDGIERVPEAAAWDGADETVLAVVRGEDEGIVAQAPVRVRRLVTALRLYDEACVAMGPAAWVRTAGGPWQAVPTGAGGHASGLLVLEAGQEDELRAFCNLVWRRMPQGEELAWALSRFEMGCERAAHHRLTDHLLALHALLDPDGDGNLAERVAAVCAAPEARRSVAQRVALALELERELITGQIGGVPGLEDIAAELTGHLRAILRDVLCGHLDTDLRGLADELLGDVEIEVGPVEGVPV